MSVSSGQSTSLSLLQRVRDRDLEAWQRLLRLYGPLVDYWSGHWGVRGADAEDVRQEVFQAVAGKLESFRLGQPGVSFRSWLRGIARHKLLDYVRRRQSQPAAQGGTEAQIWFRQVPGDEGADLDDSPEQVTGLYHRALELVRSEFEERTWQAFWRAAVEGHTVALIAADLAVSPAAVRQAKSRVLRRLKEEVGDLIA